MIEIKPSENGYIEISVKTNSKETKIISYDSSKNIYKMSVCAQPIEGQANTEIIKFFRKKYSYDVEIKSGLTSSKKLIRIKNFDEINNRDVKNIINNKKTNRK